MITVGELKFAYANTISVDIDDDGFLYFKQGGDWVCLPLDRAADLITALELALEYRE